MRRRFFQLPLLSLKEVICDVRDSADGRRHLSLQTRRSTIIIAVLFLVLAMLFSSVAVALLARLAR